MENVGTLVGNSTDFPNAVDVSSSGFVGVFDKSLWDSEGDATKFYGTHGTYISSDNTGKSIYGRNAENVCRAKLSRHTI